MLRHAPSSLVYFFYIYPHSRCVTLLLVCPSLNLVRRSHNRSRSNNDLSITLAAGALLLNLTAITPSSATEPLLPPELSIQEDSTVRLLLRLSAAQPVAELALLVNNRVSRKSRWLLIGPLAAGIKSCVCE